MHTFESIASAEKSEDFWIKQSKLYKKPKKLDNLAVNSDINPSRFST